MIQSPYMRKRIQGTRSSIVIPAFAALCLLFLCVSQIWLFRESERERAQRSHFLVSSLVTIADNNIDRAVKLGQMLALDPEVSKFIHQKGLDPGSSDIQTMIDILWKLPAGKNVNPIIADILIYSKTSDYLMNSTNLFFDIERMYPIFRIEGLSALQFRSFYLSSRSSGFFPAVEALIDNRSVRVVPYIQISPLSYQSANRGKIMLLLKADYLEKSIKSIFNGRDGWFLISDDKNGIISSSVPETTEEHMAALSLHDGYHDNIGIGGKRYSISVITGPATGLRYICAVTENGLLPDEIPSVFIMTFFLLILLSSSLLFGFFHLLKSRRHWNRLKDLLGNTAGGFSDRLVAETVSAILRDERRNEGTGEKTLPFRYDIVFRRYIHSTGQTDGELEALLDVIHGPPWKNGDKWKLLKIIIRGEAQSDPDTLDFLRIVTERELGESFGGRGHTIMDHIMGTWVLTWSASAASLERSIRIFREKLGKMLPFDVFVVTSGVKSDLDGLRKAVNECSLTSLLLDCSAAGDVCIDYDEAAKRSGKPVFTPDMEKALLAAAASNDTEETERIIDLIRNENCTKESLSPENTKKLLSRLHLAAVRYTIKRGADRIPSAFTSFNDVRLFFLTQAGEKIQSKTEIEKQTVDAITDYIERNYPDPSLNLSRAAGDLGMKENFLYHFMLTRIGRTFADYLEEYRLEKAVTALMSGDGKAINAVALECGYTNPQTFRRAFKRRYGRLPSVFRTK